MQSQLCRIPKFINFQYHQGQQLNTFLIIENLVDKVVDFKIKSNQPELYLVKPMEGSIYKKETIKITFKRKQLLKQNFQSYLINPSSLQEKFLIEIHCIDYDVLGEKKILTQSTIVFARFNVNVENREPEIQATGKMPNIKKQDIIKGLKSTINARENEMGRLIDEQNKITRRVNAPKQQLSISKFDVINLLVLFFLVGLAL